MNKRIKNKILEITKTLLWTNPETKKHFSFLVYKNRILSIGQNSNKSHTLVYYNKYKGITKHSEIDAVLKLRWHDIDWHKVYIVNTRINIFNKYGMCKPCKYCHNFLRAQGIRKVYYQDHNGQFNKMMLLGSNK